MDSKGIVILIRAIFLIIGWICVFLSYRKLNDRDIKANAKRYEEGNKKTYRPQLIYLYRLLWVSGAVICVIILFRIFTGSLHRVYFIFVLVGALIAIIFTYFAQQCKNYQDAAFLVEREKEIEEITKEGFEKRYAKAVKKILLWLTLTIVLILLFGSELFEFFS